MVAGAAQGVTAALGVPFVAQAVATATRSRLRVLAYHGIPDPSAFAEQLDHLAAHYRPVAGHEVADALRTGAPLPKRAVWVTFDDGRPEVVGAGLDLLAARNIPATMFVCAGVLGSDEPYWWDVVEAGIAAGIDVDESAGCGGPLATGAATRLKTVPDAERRRVVSAIAAALDAAGHPCRTPQLSHDALGKWVAQGMEVANHTWDHPCLDRCDEAEQERQITRAHEALADLLGSPPSSFAYPNGNVTASARAAVRRLGYSLAVDFAHRLCTRGDDPLRVPRLRVDTDAPLPRYRAIVSGGHPLVFGLRHPAGATAAGS